jgi:acetolactate synthase-1/2/3 large subunit
MAQIDGGDIVARMLKREGIDTVFTLSGGHIQNIYDGCIDEGIRVIDTRHEQVAGHAAEGYSRLTRKCGVALVTAGPGVTDTVTAVATAYQNASPMLVIGGAAPLRTSLMGALQEIPGTVEMMRPIRSGRRSVPETASPTTNRRSARRSPALARLLGSVRRAVRAGRRGAAQLPTIAQGAAGAPG